MAHHPAQVEGGVRKHRIICCGVFEERIYEDGKLVEIRRYVLGPEMVTRRAARHALPGRRIA